MYEVDDKNKPETPVLMIREYPTEYPSEIFPINVTITEIKRVNDTANGKVLFLHMTKYVASCTCYITV